MSPTTRTLRICLVALAFVGATLPASKYLATAYGPAFESQLEFEAALASLPTRVENGRIASLPTRVENGRMQLPTRVENGRIASLPTRVENGRMQLPTRVENGKVADQAIGRAPSSRLSIDNARRPGIIKTNRTIRA